VISQKKKKILKRLNHERGCKPIFIEKEISYN